MADSDPAFEGWKVVSTRIEGFDKMLLDVRLRVLGYSAVAAGVVSVFSDGQDLPGATVALLFAFIALAVMAIMVADTTYYHQLLIAAVIVAGHHEKASQSGSTQIPALHSTVRKGVNPTPRWLFGFSYVLPTLVLVVLTFRSSPCVGWFAIVCAIFAFALSSIKLWSAEQAIKKVEFASIDR